MGGSSWQCQVCNEAQFQICSLPFYKNHKETPCAKPESAEEKLSSVPQFQAERPVDVDGPSEMLQKLQLEAIASSIEIGNVLKDKHLPVILTNPQIQ